MIAKGKERGDGAQLADYLQSERDDDGKRQRVEAGLIRGVAATTLRGAIAEMEARAFGSRLSAPLWHCHIAPDREMSPDQWRGAWEIYEQVHRLQHHPFAEEWHYVDGRVPHAHRVYGRVDDQGNTMSVWRSKLRDELASRITEFEFQHPYTAMKTAHVRTVATWAREIGRADVAEWIEQQAATVKVRGGEALITPAEHQQERRTRIPVANIRVAVLDAYRHGDNARAFVAALQAHGLMLARGDRAAVLVVDGAGGQHELIRTITAALKAEGQPTPRREVAATLAARFGELDVDALSPASEARRGARASAEQAAAVAAIEGAGTAPESKADQLDPLDLAANGRAVFSGADLRRACWKIAGRDGAKALEAEQLDRSDLITVGRDDEGRRLFTTRPIAEAEATITRLARAGGADRRHALRAVDVDARLDRYRAELVTRTGYDLKAEQVAAVRHITAGADLACVTGAAGAGKSTMLAAAAELWRADGYRVDGAALSGKAAAGLGEIGIQSSTLAAWTLRFDRQAAYDAARRTGNLDQVSHIEEGTTVRDALCASLDGWGSKVEQQRRSAKTEVAAQAAERTRAWIKGARAELVAAADINALSSSVRRWADKAFDRELKDRVDRETVLVIDETGMVGHRQLAGVLERGRSAGAKVVLVGDAEQLQPIAPGAAYRVITDEIGAADLIEVVRQREEWQRQATVDFASGDTRKAAAAISAYAQHNRIHTGIIGLGSDRERLYAQAADKLGCELTDRDRQQIDRVARYAEARLVAGTLWREIQAAGGRPEDHPSYRKFDEARGARATAAEEIASDLDAAKPWLARYRIDGEGLAADIMAAAGKRRSEAQTEAAGEAGRLGLADLEAEADVTLSFDWRAGARAELVAQWVADLAAAPEKSALILAYTRDDVARLNMAARAEFGRLGRLFGPDAQIDTSSGPLAVAIGDRLVTLKNVGRDIRNGSLGTVESITQNDAGATILAVRLDGGPTIEIDTSSYRELAHGYAITVHKSQGATVDRTYTLAHRQLDRHLWYVAMSRHRDDVRVFASSADFMTPDAVVVSARRARSANAIRDHCDVMAAAAGGIETPAERLATPDLINSEPAFEGGTRHVRPRVAHAPRIGAEPPPAARGRLRDLSALPLVYDPEQSPGLLPRDVPRDLGQPEPAAGRGDDHGVRRPEPRIVPATTDALRAPVAPADTEDEAPAPAPSTTPSARPERAPEHYGEPAMATQQQSQGEWVKVGNIWVRGLPFLWAFQRSERDRAEALRAKELELRAREFALRERELVAREKAVRERDTADDGARLEARARTEVRAYLERTGQTDEAMAARSAQARRRYEPGQSVTPGGLWQRIGANANLGHWQSVVNGSTTYRVVEAADLDGRRHVHARREEMRENGETYLVWAQEARSAGEAAKVATRHMAEHHQADDAKQPQLPSVQVRRESDMAAVDAAEPVDLERAMRGLPRAVPEVASAHSTLDGQAVIDTEEAEAKDMMAAVEAPQSAPPQPQPSPPAERAPASRPDAQHSASQVQEPAEKAAYDRYLDARAQFSAARRAETTNAPGASAPVQHWRDAMDAAAADVIADPAQAARAKAEGQLERVESCAADHQKRTQAETPTEEAGAEHRPESERPAVHEADEEAEA